MAYCSDQFQPSIQRQPTSIMMRHAAHQVHPCQPTQLIPVDDGATELPSTPTKAGQASPAKAAPSKSANNNNNTAKTKRKQVRNACVNCQKACKKCDDGRPCQRCIRLGLTATCTNSARKERKKGVKRGPYRKRLSTTKELFNVQNNSPSSNNAAVHAGEAPPPPPPLALSMPFQPPTATVQSHSRQPLLHIDTTMTGKGIPTWQQSFDLHPMADRASGPLYPQQPVFHGLLDAYSDNLQPSYLARPFVSREPQQPLFSHVPAEPMVQVDPMSSHAYLYPSECDPFTASCQPSVMPVSYTLPSFDTQHSPLSADNLSLSDHSATWSPISPTPLPDQHFTPSYSSILSTPQPVVYSQPDAIDPFIIPNTVNPLAPVPWQDTSFAMAAFH